ncbi:hypothetical protein RB195_002792 [Necator americanus]|uniref:7TM GPCR serpentine receptor class x (Srx) domain-containing protein n=1 Tax=Necator americanus TaxID=51031 RepID=A0ABR1DKX1_NECAM
MTIAVRRDETCVCRNSLRVLFRHFIYEGTGFGRVLDDNTFLQYLENFRNVTVILLLMLTFSGQFSASLNFIAAVMDFMNMDQMRVRNVLLIQRYTESMFFVANLATCIERSVAVLAVSSYEKYISRFISVSIVIAVVFTSSGAATFLIVFMDMYQDSTLKLVYYISYSLLYFLIALSVRVYRSCFRRETEVISLQDKYLLTAFSASTLLFFIIVSCGCVIKGEQLWIIRMVINIFINCGTLGMGRKTLRSGKHIQDFYFVIG